MLNVKDACAALGVDRETLFLLRDKNLESGKDWRGLPHAPWFTEEAIEKLKELQERELTTAPILQMLVLDNAKNKRFVWAWDDERKHRVAVLIPSRFAGKLKGKIIQAERIDSASGTSYRHSWFTEHKSE